MDFEGGLEKFPSLKYLFRHHQEFVCILDCSILHCLFASLEHCNNDLLVTYSWCTQKLIVTKVGSANLCSRLQPPTHRFPLVTCFSKLSQTNRAVTSILKRLCQPYWIPIQLTLTKSVFVHIVGPIWSRSLVLNLSQNWVQYFIHDIRIIHLDDI